MGKRHRLLASERGGSDMRVGSLVIDYCGDIGIIVKHVNCDCWKIHYIDGSGEGAMWQAQLRLLCE